MSGKHSAAATRPSKRAVAVLTVVALVTSFVAVQETGAGAAPDHGSVRLLVQTKAGVSAADRHAVVAGGGGTVVRNVGALPTDVVSVPAGSAAAILKHYQSDSSVKHVELDHSRKVASAASDPSYGDQWALPHIG